MPQDLWRWSLVDGGEEPLDAFVEQAVGAIVKGTQCLAVNDTYIAAISYEFFQVDSV